jgi:hypothetical protein
MPAMLKDNMEAINRYFMQQVTVKTAAAEKVKQEWMQYWKDTKRDWTWYSQEEYDKARNLRNKFDLANAVTAEAKVAVAAHQAAGQGSTEEQRGETRRSGTSGMFLEEEEPLIPTAWKAGAIIGVSLITIGVFAKQLLKLTPYGKLARFLP